MLKVFLKYDFALATWFVPKKNTGIEPVISHLFLTKISFIFFALFAVVINLLPFSIPSEITTILLILIIALIMYGFQKTVARSVKKYELRKEYKYLTKGERRKRNAIGLFLMFFVYLGACFVAIIMSGD